MRKITLIALLLFVTHNTFSQIGTLRIRAKNVIEYSEQQAEKNNFSSPEVTFASMKLAGLDKAKVIFAEEQEQKAISLFAIQYRNLDDAFKNYKENKNHKTTYELWKVLIDNEVEFRAILSDEQLKDYLEFANDHGIGEGYIFDMVFMSDKQLAKYKKEIE